MAMHGNTWQYMAIHGNTWQYVAMHGNTCLTYVTNNRCTVVTSAGLRMSREEVEQVVEAAAAAAVVEAAAEDRKEVMEGFIYKRQLSLMHG
jgi:acyl-coenzyme A synthetase/AMP-(fatty) acid ligase